MHENNLINRISLIFENLKCKEIIDFLNQWNIDKVRLLSLVIESKLGYDRIILDEECKKFIDDIEESSIYSVAEYSQLIMFISTMGEMNSRFNSDSAILNRFQTFHKMLYKTGSLVLKLLHENNEIMNYLNPQAGEGMVENPLRNNTTQPPAAPQPSSSKVVTVDFSKIATQQNPVPATLAQKPVEPTKQSFSNKETDTHEQFKPHPMTAQTGVEVLEDDDMSLTNFLQSLAMLNVPAE